MKEFKKGDKVVVIPNKKEVSIGIFYNVGDVGIVIECSQQESLDVEFGNGPLLISHKSLELFKGGKK
jgi:hypothetical protein